MGPTNSSATVNFPMSLNEIATSQPAGPAIFKALSERIRARRTTDLNRLHVHILDSIDSTVSEKSFLEVFRALEQIGAGKLIIGRKNRPNRFRWNYSLKDAAQAANQNKPISELNVLGRKPRVVKRKTRTVKHTRKARTVKPLPLARVVTAQTTVKPPSGIVINITLPSNAKPEEIKAFLELAKGLQG